MDEHADAAGISSKVIYTMFLAMRLLGNELNNQKTQLPFKARKLGVFF